MDRAVLSDALSDLKWERIEPLLSGRFGNVGVTCWENRRFVEAVFHVDKTGIPWRDLPPHLGHWKSVYNRFNRWSKDGLWERVFNTLAEDHAVETLMLDSTITCAHHHAAGQKGGKKTKR